MSDKRQTQADEILQLLEKWEGNWVPLPYIMRLGIACHTRRIHELRKAGYEIEMREQHVGRERHIAYRLVTQQPVEVVS